MNKVVRLPDGRFITRKIVVSDPASLSFASPDEIWEMSDGNRVVVKDMDLKHMINAIFWCEKKATEELKRLGVGEPENETQAEAFKSAFNKIVKPQYHKMRDELEIRLGKKERKPEPEPRRRAIDLTR